VEWKGSIGIYEPTEGSSLSVEGISRGRHSESRIYKAIFRQPWSHYDAGKLTLLSVSLEISLNKTVGLLTSQIDLWENYLARTSDMFFAESRLSHTKFYFGSPGSPLLLQDPGREVLLSLRISRAHVLRDDGAWSLNFSPGVYNLQYEDKSVPFSYLLSAHKDLVILDFQLLTITCLPNTLQ